jgi:hypothetical protein
VGADELVYNIYGLVLLHAIEVDVEEWFVQLAQISQSQAAPRGGPPMGEEHRTIGL